MQSTKKNTLAISLLLLPAFACSSVQERWRSRYTEVPDGLLQYADEERMSSVDDARQDRDRMRDNVASARQAKDDAEQSRAVLRGELDVANERVRVAKLRVTSQRDGKQAAFDDARADVDAAEAEVVEARRAVELNELRIEMYEADIDVAEARQRLAEERVELAKAHAVAELDRPEAKAIDVSTFETRVREREKEVALSEVEHTAAKREYDLATERGADEQIDGQNDSMNSDDSRGNARRADGSQPR